MVVSAVCLAVPVRDMDHPEGRTTHMRKTCRMPRSTILLPCFECFSDGSIPTLENPPYNMVLHTSPIQEISRCCITTGISK